MKKIKTFIPIILAFVLLIPSLLLMGCTPTVSDVSDNIDSLYTTLSDNSTLFVKNSNADYYATDYYNLELNITYDSSTETEFAEIVEEFELYYNPIFSYAISYITENKVIVTNYLEEDLPKTSKNALEEFNDDLVDMISDLKTVASAYKTLENNLSKSTSVAARLAYLRKFEDKFSDAVVSSVAVATSLAEFVNSTGTLSAVTANADIDTNLLLYKNYICTTILPVFTEFYIDEFCGFNWSGSAETETKTRINEIRDQMQAIFTGDFENLITAQVSGSYLSNITSSTELSNLLDEIETKISNFQNEVLAVEKALDYLDIEELASVKYQNNLSLYLSDNPFAETCIERIENFVNEVVPTFVSYISGYFTETI